MLVYVDDAVAEIEYIKLRPVACPPLAESGKLPCIIARTASPVNPPDWKFVEDRPRTSAADL